MAQPMHSRRGPAICMPSQRGIVLPVRTTIDRSGRIVVPKALRDALGLEGGQEIEVTARDGKLEVTVAPTPIRLQRRGKHVVAVPQRDLPTLTAALVRETLEHTRR